MTTQSNEKLADVDKALADHIKWLEKMGYNEPKDKLVKTLERAKSDLCVRENPQNKTQDNLCTVDDTQADLSAPVGDRGWQPIETCKPFKGLVAYVAFEDGFYSLAKYEDFTDEKGRVNFWSLSHFHNDSDIYKHYGNRIDPVLWYAVPNPVPKPTALSTPPQSDCAEGLDFDGINLRKLHDATEAFDPSMRHGVSGRESHREFVFWILKTIYEDQTKHAEKGE